MTRVTLQLPDDLHRRLQAHSRRTGASLNQVIVAALSEAAVSEEDARGEVEGPLKQRVENIRTALGDLAVTLDFEYLPPHLRPDDDLPDTDMFRHSLPQLDPPLSATIIAEREDRF